MYGTSVCKFDSRNFPLFYNSYIKPLSLISMTWLTYSQVIKHIQDSERKQIKQFWFLCVFFFLIQVLRSKAPQSPQES